MSTETNRLLNRATTVCLGSLILLAGCAGGTGKADSAHPRPTMASITEAVQAFDAGWNAHDPKMLSALTAAGAVTLTPSGSRIEGSSAHHDMYASAGPTKQTQSKTTVQGVQWLDDDLVLLDLTQQLDGPGVAQLGSDSARAVTVMRWDGAEWKIVAARPYVPAVR